MKNKKGAGIGFLPVSFVVTIIIVLALILFVFGAGLLKEVDRSKAGLKMYEEEELSLGNSVDSYMKEDFKKITEIRAMKQENRKNVEEYLELGDKGNEEEEGEENE